MKKYIGYIPPVLFLTFYLLAGLTGVSMALFMILIWVACFLLAAVLLYKGIIWGSVFGAFPSLHMIYRGGSEIFVGIALLLFYLGLSIYLWKKQDTDAPATSNKEVLVFFAKIALTVLVIVASGYAAVIGGMILMSEGIHQVFAYIGMLVLPSLLLPLIWLKKRKKFLIINTFGMSFAMFVVFLSGNLVMYFIGACMIQFFIPHDMHVVYIMESSPAKNRARIYSVIKFFANMSVMLVPVLRRLLMADSSQWRNVYLVPAIVGIITSLIALLFA